MCRDDAAEGGGRSLPPPPFVNASNSKFAEFYLPCNRLHGIMVTCTDGDGDDEASRLARPGSLFPSHDRCRCLGSEKGEECERFLHRRRLNALVALRHLASHVWLQLCRLRRLRGTGLHVWHYRV